MDELCSLLALLACHNHNSLASPEITPTYLCSVYKATQNATKFLFSCSVLLQVLDVQLHHMLSIDPQKSFGSF